MPSSKTIAERERIRTELPKEFDDGARVGFTGHAEGPRDRGDYPPNFHQWALERRDAWFAGFNAGHHARKASKGK